MLDLWIVLYCSVFLFFVGVFCVESPKRKINSDDSFSEYESNVKENE